VQQIEERANIQLQATNEQNEKEQTQCRSVPPHLLMIEKGLKANKQKTCCHTPPIALAKTLKHVGG